MKNRVVVIIVALVVVLVGAVGVFAATRPATEPSAGSSASEPAAVSEQPQTSSDAESGDASGAAAGGDAASGDAAAGNAASGAAAASAGSYVDYSDTAIASAQGRTFLFFHASWCPICRTLDSDILASGVPAGVTIFKVDYDSHQDLRQKYGVTQQTTIVEVDAAGNGLQNYVAYDDPTLQTVLGAML